MIESRALQERGLGEDVGDDRIESTKRILVDASMAHGGGGFTYLVNVVPRLSRQNPGAKFLLLLRNRTLAESLPEMPNVEIELLPDVGFFGRFAFLLRGTAGLARAFGADLYFSTAEYLPIGLPCPAVVSFRNPNVFTDLDQGWQPYQRFRLGSLRRLASVSAKRSKRIVFVSHDSASWIGDVMKIPATKRAVVHHGIDTTMWKPHAGTLSRESSGILSVSTVYRYKNFVKLIEAYAVVAKSSTELPPLTIIGDVVDDPYRARMAKARAATGDLADKIHIIGATPYRELPAWYASAELFVFPSYLETFGHPLLEAMASGLPTLAADIPVFREIAGDAVAYADPHDEFSLAAELSKLLDSESRRTELIEKANARIREFGWGRTASTLMGVLESTLDASP